ncbi:MAG: 2-oxoacid:acceptor oxidoreductase family protein [Candidatus Sungbacteria bacterium]|nr:2-oxoacid:acceptor oxidoreductase family protein [Candidatus Sungbacteria bacterium]
MDRFSIRFHGLGGQGLKSMIQEMLAPILLRSGFQVQAFPFFGGERRGAAVAGYLRCGRKKISTHSFISEPDMVVVFDHERVQLAKALEGLKPGGIVVINTSAPNQFMGLTHDWLVYTLNCRSISLGCGIGEPSDPFTVVNSAMAGGVARILESVFGAQFPDDLADAVLGEALPQKVSENQKAFLEGKRTVVRLMADGMPVWQLLIKSRNFPYLVQPDERCTACNLCYLFCPKRAIEVTAGGRYVIHEEKCNYCAICVAICPLDAIIMRLEESSKLDSAVMQGGGDHGR